MRPLALLPLTLLAACAAPGGGGGGAAPGYGQALRAIEWHYETHAWERNATCIPPRLVGVTGTRVVEDTAERLVLDVRYLWDAGRGGFGGGGFGFGGFGPFGRDRDDGWSGVPCYGQGERTFVLARHTGGGGYSVTSMSGPGRG